MQGSRRRKLAAALVAVIAFAGTSTPAMAKTPKPVAGHYGPLSTTVLSKCKDLCLFKFGVAADRKHVIISPKGPAESRFNFYFAIQNRKATCNPPLSADEFGSLPYATISVYEQNFGRDGYPAGSYPALGSNPAGSYPAGKALPHWVKIDSKGKWQITLSNTGRSEGEDPEGPVYRNTVTFKGQVKTAKSMTMTATLSNAVLYPGVTWELPSPIYDEAGNVIGTDPGSGPFIPRKCIGNPVKWTSKWRKPTSTGL